MLTFEVCLETADDARAAAAGGADRLELCRDLSVGGLTPELDVVREVVAATGLSVVAMLRDRPGDFHYSESELFAMEKKIAPLLQAGSRGIVFGAIDGEGMPNIDAVQRVRLAILDVAADAQVPEFIFHRAFDTVPDPVAALESLIEAGVDRVLTSGHPDGVSNGMGELAALVQQAGNRITVMPGGGVRADNISELLATTGAREIHFSARPDPRTATDERSVRNLLRIARA